MKRSGMPDCSCETEENEKVVVSKKGTKEAGGRKKIGKTNRASKKDNIAELIRKEAEGPRRKGERGKKEGGGPDQ